MLKAIKLMVIGLCISLQIVNFILITSLHINLTLNDGLAVKFNLWRAVAMLFCVL